MPRVKVKVDRGNGLQQTVVIDTDATRGATIGRDVFNADGTLFVPASGGGGSSSDIRNGYGILISGTSPKTISVNRAAAFAWQGQHSWEKPLWAPHGTAALPAFTWEDDPDTGIYWVGANNIGVATGGALRWDATSARTYQSVMLQARVADGYIARFENLTDPDAGARVYTAYGVNGSDVYFDFHEANDRYFRLGNRANPLNNAFFELMRFGSNAGTLDGTVFSVARESRGINLYEQALLADGTAAAPGAAFTDEGGLGVFRVGAGQLGLSALTSVTHVANGTATGVITYNLNASSTAGYTVADENAVARVRLGYSNNTDRPFLNVSSAVDMTFQQGGTVMIDFLQAGHWRTRDGIELRAGTGDDLRLFHDGTNSTIRNDTGNLSILSGATEVIRFTQSNPRVVAHVGAVGTPSFSFIGDENTGMYRVGADQLGLVAGGAVGAQVDLTSTAGNTRLLVYDVDNATLERVTVGAADSGGTGFKVLRIPN